MSQEQKEFFDTRGPTASATASASKIFNITLSAATSTATDLTGANYTGLKNAMDDGRLLTLTAQVDIWYRWATATGTVDETKDAGTTPANQGILLPAGIRITERAPLGASWIIAKATPTAGILCIQVSSISPNAGMGGSFGT